MIPAVFTLTGLEPDVPIKFAALFFHVLPKIFSEPRSEYITWSVITFVFRVEIGRVMVRQTATAARDGTVLLAPCPRDMRLGQPVCEAVDVQIARRARNAVRRGVRPRRGRPRPDVRPGPRVVLSELRRAVAGYA